LADWFSGQEPGAGADEIWDKVEHQEVSDTLRLERWDSEAEVVERLLDVLVEELGLVDRDDVTGFGQSLGGTLFGEPPHNLYYHRGRLVDEQGESMVESWQILSPVHGLAHGVADLNRQIQRHFRMATLERARSWRSKIPKPMGPEEIVYGDKVMNTRNMHRWKVYPGVDALQYVANGEIGLVVGEYKKSGGKPRRLYVEFSSQPNYSYTFERSDFGEEATAQLELAYAITIHKSQGSEFGTTIIVLPNPCRLLSRELLYTALTRQRRRIVILHQGDFTLFKQFATPAASETARRLTNLFGPPDPRTIEGHFLEGNLIHGTRRGEAVRSKSEVIIADLLYSKRLPYEYETRLVGSDGRVRYPDFTIDDAESGQVVYWEHLGLLHIPTYRESWERKLAWYRSQGILPAKEGGGEQGTLVTTRDDERGGISSAQLEQIVNEVFGL
jgi:hypothetical protein